MKVPFPDPLLTTHAADVTTDGFVGLETEQLVSVVGTPVRVNFTSVPEGPDVGVRTRPKLSTLKDS
jgi:hypothetical protein